VSSLDVTSIRSLRKGVDALDQMGVKGNRTLVLNRCDAKVGLHPSDAEEALGMKISCSIPSSRELPLALNLGTPVVVNEPKSAAAKQLQQLAELLAPVGPAKARTRWRR
jgi:pilus assembly protein CpaE